MKNIFKNQNGATLMEVVIVISIFIFVMIITTSIFQSVLKVQRNAIAARNVQENMKFMMEVVSKEMRAAKKLSAIDECELSGMADAEFSVYNTNPGSAFNADSEIFYFKNKNKECTYYYLKNGTLMIRRDDYFASATPASIKITDMQFVFEDVYYGEFPVLQPNATLKMEVEAATGKAEDKNKIILQTTVSSRQY